MDKNCNNIDKKSRLSKELLRIADSDIKASEILYEQGLYAQSYFSFQQATEKITKSFFLDAGFSEPGESFNVRHNLFKLHRKLFIEAQNSNREYLLLVDAYPFLKTSESPKKSKIEEQILLSEKTVDTISKLKEYDLINITAKDIKVFLKKIESLESISFLSIPDLEIKVEIVFQQLISDIRSHGSKVALYIAKSLETEITDPEWGKFITEHFADVLKTTNEVMYAYSVLYLSSYLTIQHSSLSRYPDTQNPEKSPTRIYTKRLPIVKFQPLFLNHLKKVITIIQKIQE
jgi:HEPN domain-containing protein